MPVTRQLVIRAAAALAVGLAMIPGAMAQTRTLAMTMVVEHPVLDAVKAGVLDELKAQGFEGGKNLKVDYRNAQGNPTVAAQIARQFAGSAPDVIVAITTTSAQAVVSSTSTIPVVFGAITDPVGAKLVSGPGSTGKNVTGTSDYPPVPQQVEVIKKILPAAKRIGVVYSPGEANSLAQTNMLKAEATKAGFIVVEASVIKSADVQQAARSLLGKVDLIYVPGDNAVVGAIDALLSVANKAKVPVFTPESATVEKGAFAAIGHDYYKIGRQTGAMAADILNGKPAGSIPWAIGAETELAINTATAKALGIAIPDSVAKRARMIDVKGN